MRRRLLIVVLVLVPIALIWGLLRLPNYMAGVHQRNVTRELSDWEVEYSKIESQHDAVRAAEMLGYIQGYYVPSEGYRSTPEIEASLESQRQETVDSIVFSLGEYTNRYFSDNYEKWLIFLRSSPPFERPKSGSADFSKLVDTLSAEHSRDAALAARRELVAGGRQAFPTLLKRLDDTTITQIDFLGSVSTTDAPPIGQVCFEILQMQIEGRWPKSFREYHILDLTNISKWVEEHSSKSLFEMRHIALTQAIQNVQGQIKAELEPKHPTMLLSFLREKKLLIDKPEFDFGKPVENPFD